MANRKHITEIALGFYSRAIILLHPKDLRELEHLPPETSAVAADCHIYLIVTRPRLSFVPGSINVGETKTSGKFKYIRGGISHEVNFHLDGKPNADKIEISDYPHTKLSLIKNNEIFASLPAHLVSLKCNDIDDNSIRDLEVQYVGMSYADGNRSAKDRLLSHSTLQQVLADLNHDSPDTEALLIMVQYESPQTLISFDGRDETLRLEDDRDLLSDLKRQQNEITEDLQIALIEASLIKYFQPPYNEKYKKRFPSPTHKILEEVYNIDFGALTVEINTEDINTRLYSKNQLPGYHHISNFDLHDSIVRRSFFNVMNVASGSDAPDFSGPVY